MCAYVCVRMYMCNQFLNYFIFVIDVCIFMYMYLTCMYIGIYLCVYVYLCVYIYIYINVIKKMFSAFGRRTLEWSTSRIKNGFIFRTFQKQS